MTTPLQETITNNNRHTWQETKHHKMINATSYRRLSLVITHTPFSRRSHITIATRDKNQSTHDSYVIQTAGDKPVYTFIVQVGGRKNFFTSAKASSTTVLSLQELYPIGGGHCKTRIIYFKMVRGCENKSLSLFRPLALILSELKVPCVLPVGG